MEETVMPEPTTKSVYLPIPAAAAFEFLARVDEWPRWAVHNVLRSEPRGAARWAIETPRGAGQIVMRADAEHGVLDHDFVDGEGNGWTVPARVVDVPGGSVFMMTFTPPPAMPHAVFEQGMRELDEELATLRRILSA